MKPYFLIKLMYFFCVIVVSFFNFFVIGCTEFKPIPPETPAIYSISPSSGTTNTIVTLTGYNFTDETGYIKPKVKIGNQVVTTLDKSSDKEIIFKMPNLGTVGTYPVSVITETGESNSKEFTFGASVRRLFISNGGNNSVRSFDITWTDGNIAPQQIFTQSMSMPFGISVVNNELFVSNEQADTVTVYSATATNNPAPKHFFSKDMYYPRGICNAYNELFVTHYGANAVTVYSATATNNPDIKRYFLNSIKVPIGIYVDAAKDEMFITNYQNYIVNALYTTIFSN